MQPSWKDKLKKAWNDNPLACIAIGALAVGATAKLIDSLSGVQSRNAYARRMNHGSSRYPYSR